MFSSACFHRTASYYLPLPLVAVVEDGNQIIRVAPSSLLLEGLDVAALVLHQFDYYRYEDAQVTTINGAPAMTYLLEWAGRYVGQYRDSGVRFNLLFARRVVSKATGAVIATQGAFAQRSLVPTNDSVVVELLLATSATPVQITVPWVAVLPTNFDSATSYWAANCATPRQPTPSAAAAAASATASASTASPSAAAAAAAARAGGFGAAGGALGARSRAGGEEMALITDGGKGEGGTEGTEKGAEGTVGSVVWGSSRVGMGESSRERASGWPTLAVEFPRPDLDARPSLLRPPPPPPAAPLLLRAVVPSAVVPSAVVPSAVVPSAVVPSAVVPSAVVPSAVVPSAVVPSAVVPSAVVPSAVVPSAVVPSAVVPSAVVPSAVVPSAVVPSAVVPSAVVPSAVVPSAVVPSAVVPSAVVPSAVVPSAVVPSAVVPSAVVPSAVYLLADNTTAVIWLHTFLPALDGSDEALIAFLLAEISTAVDLANQHGRRILMDVSGNGGGYADIAYLLLRLVAGKQKAPKGRVQMPQQLLISNALMLSLLDQQLTSFYQWDKYVRVDETTPVKSARDFKPFLEEKFSPDGQTGVYSGLFKLAVFPGLEKVPFRGPVFGNRPLVIVTNGNCFSACAIFTHNLRKRFNVKHVTVGGVLGEPLGISASCMGATMPSLETGVTNFLTGTKLADHPRAPKPFPYNVVQGVAVVQGYVEDKVPCEYVFLPGDQHVDLTMDKVANPALVWEEASQYF
ncbi:unnamed protein product [Closterium sp. Naga37s-1]|nr:unnamed protein product [Closterium sp. Naga37s-1]